MSDHTLPLTGERTVPGVAIENYWFARHVAAYRFAVGRSRGLRVVDSGCGEGYGTAMLAATARTALGVDRDGAVVAHARRAYPGVEFAEADLCRLPLPDAAFDAVVSLQVVEHLPDVGRCLAEAARVLRPGGELLCATPNRLTFSPGGAPVNPFHVREYAPAELQTCSAGTSGSRPCSGCTTARGSAPSSARRHGRSPNCSQSAHPTTGRAGSAPRSRA